MLRLPCKICEIIRKSKILSRKCDNPENHRCFKFEATKVREISEDKEIKSIGKWEKEKRMQNKIRDSVKGVKKLVEKSARTAAKIAIGCESKSWQIEKIAIIKRCKEKDIIINGSWA